MPSGIGTHTHRPPLETLDTQPLGSTRGDEPQGRWRGGEGVREAGVASFMRDVQGRTRREYFKKFFFDSMETWDGGS